MLLVTKSLGSRHTQTHRESHTHTDIHTKAILRNQVHPGLWLVCPGLKTWFFKAVHIPISGEYCTFLLYSCPGKNVLQDS